MMISIESPEVIRCFYCECELKHIHYYFDHFDNGEMLPVCGECFEFHTRATKLFMNMFESMVALGPPC